MSISPILRKGLPIPVSSPEAQAVIAFGDFWGPSGTSGDHLGTSGDHLGTIWEIDSMKLSVSLRIRTFRSARIDPRSPKSTTTASFSCHHHTRAALALQLACAHVFSAKLAAHQQKNDFLAATLRSRLPRGRPPDPWRSPERAGAATHPPDATRLRDSTKYTDYHTPRRPAGRRAAMTGA